MKKRIVLFSFFSLLIFGCKSSQNDSPKKLQVITLNDHWLLKKVSYDEPNMHDRIILFNDVTNFCFEQSLWKFSSTSKTGTYSINDLYCSYGKRNIIFSVKKDYNNAGLYDIYLKTTLKDGKINDFKVKLVELSDNSMQWHYTTQVNNKPYNINISFEKI